VETLELVAFVRAQTMVRLLSWLIELQNTGWTGENAMQVRAPGLARSISSCISLWGTPMVLSINATFVTV
jgi:hypothetical protein